MDVVLVLNAGSSSLKFDLFAVADRDAPVSVLRGQIDGIGAAPRFRASHGDGSTLTMLRVDDASNHRRAIELLLDWLDAETRARGAHLIGAGHRVVHGGTERTAPARLTADLVDELDALCPLAPHHQPHNIAAIRAVARRAPELPQVACFDTAFHATQPAVARRLGLPRDTWDRGIRRYGFHGTSYEYVVHALPALTGGALPPRLIVAHLGNGASACAIADGRSIATTMGFSTLDGLLMGTRGGDLDAGVILHLMRAEGLDRAGLEDLLYNRSGLLGVSGLSRDMRELLDSDTDGAREAVELFCYRLVRAIGSLAAALGGLDAVVFTGGIGEHAAPVRAEVCHALGWLGLEIDEAANASHGPLISAPGAVAAWVVPANEELMIARHTARLLAPG